MPARMKEMSGEGRAGTTFTRQGEREATTEGDGGRGDKGENPGDLTHFTNPSGVYLKVLGAIGEYSPGKQPGLAN